eukprot:3934501-Rhodomonas_salina.3
MAMASAGRSSRKWGSKWCACFQCTSGCVHCSETESFAKTALPLSAQRTHVREIGVSRLRFMSRLRHAGGASDSIACRGRTLAEEGQARRSERDQPILLGAWRRSRGVVEGGGEHAARGRLVVVGVGADGVEEVHHLQRPATRPREQAEQTERQQSTTTCGAHGNGGVGSRVSAVPPGRPHRPRPRPRTAAQAGRGRCRGAPPKASPSVACCRSTQTARACAGRSAQAGQCPAASPLSAPRAPGCGSRARRWRGAGCPACATPA